MANAKQATALVKLLERARMQRPELYQEALTVLKINGKVDKEILKAVPDAKFAQAMELLLPLKGDSPPSPERSGEYKATVLWWQKILNILDESDPKGKVVSLHIRARVRHLTSDGVLGVGSNCITPTVQDSKHQILKIFEGTIPDDHLCFLIGMTPQEMEAYRKKETQFTQQLRAEVEELNERGRVRFAYKLFFPDATEEQVERDLDKWEELKRLYAKIGRSEVVWNKHISENGGPREAFRLEGLLACSNRVQQAIESANQKAKKIRARQQLRV